MKPCSRTFFTLNSMCFINCCRTERNQPTTFAQEPTDCSLTVKHSVTANEFITRMLYKDVLINYQEHLLGHIICFCRCGPSPAYFTEINEWLTDCIRICISCELQYSYCWWTSLPVDQVCPAMFTIHHQLSP